MAVTNLTGSVYAVGINPDGSPSTRGRVQQNSPDPTIPGTIYPFNDPNFPNSGLDDGDQCLFDLDTTNTAINLRPLSVTRTITGPVTENIVVNQGDMITIKSAAAIVTGSITINGGQVNLNNNASITNGVTVNGNGVLVAKTGGQVNGGIVINSGGSLRVINGGKIMGGIVVQSGNRLQVGNKNGPGSISGPIDISDVKSFHMTPGSSITS